MSSDIHALVGAYAVDALDDDERVAFERHLADCADCRAEVTDLRETAATLTTPTAVTPPGSLRDRVLADIATVRPLPPIAQPVERRPRRLPRPRLLVAAAAALIALGAGATIWQPWVDETSQAPRLTAAERIRAADDAETYTRTLDGGARATLIRSRALNQAVLVTSDMPPAPEGRVYELWLDHKGVGMVPAGLMTGTEREVVLEGDPATAIGFGITVEPEGGSQEPTTSPVALISLENT